MDNCFFIKANCLRHGDFEGFRALGLTAHVIYLELVGYGVRLSDVPEEFRDLISSMGGIPFV